MAYHSFSSPLPSPPMDGHALPFLPAKRLDSIRKAYASPLTPVCSQSSWFASGADSDAESEGSDDSQETSRRSSDSRLQSIPTIVLSKCQVVRKYDKSHVTNRYHFCLSATSIACFTISSLGGRHSILFECKPTPGAFVRFWEPT